MTALSQRETRNYQFDFLRPQHSLYQFFTRLVDQYTELLQVEGEDGSDLEKKRLADLEHNVQDKFHMLDRAKQRSEWVKFQEQQKQKKEEQNEQEKVAYAQIDWHDFVVVETVEFTEADEQAELPPPTSLNDLQSASLEQKAMMSLQPQGLRIEEAMPTEEENTYYNAYPAEQPQQAPTQLPQRTPSATDYTPQATATPPAPTPAREEDEEERLIRERAEARELAHATQAAAKAGATAHPGQQPMRIRSDYVPRAQAKRLNTATAATGLCPNCHQQIPLSEMEHHMRIELLDPRWKEQRAKAESRYATTNLSTTEVANNLKRLASQRSDVFDANIAEGVDQQGATLAAAAAATAEGADGDEESRRKRVATGAGIGVPSYDAEAQKGAGPQAQSMNIEEQIRHIREKYQQ